MDIQYIILIVIAVVAILAFILFKILSSNKNTIEETELPFKLEIFIENVGGINNIVSTDSSMSKITLELENTGLVNIEEIEKLGASGIVEKKDGITFIFGNISQNLEAKIKEKM